LVDVSQDVVVREEDCNTLRGIMTKALVENDKIIEPLSDRIEGRYSLQDVEHPETEEILVHEAQYIDAKIAKTIEEAGVEAVIIRSVLTCDAKSGVCTKCYGKNLATNRISERGDAVGIIAAQSIGEPGTQVISSVSGMPLTLRLFQSSVVSSSLMGSKKV